MRGDEYGKMGEHEKAISDYSRAIELKPEVEHIYTSRGREYRAVGQKQKALQDFDKAISINANDQTARFYRNATLLP
jgi:tetratricopeptide (TPR) repeat protein